MALQDLLKVSRYPCFGAYTDANFVDESIEEEVNTNVGLSMTKLALYSSPEIISHKFKDEASGKHYQIHFNKGTTTLGFMYQGGIVIAVDSRATRGNYISTHTIEKIIPINKYLIGTMAGGAADCVYWERVLSVRCRLHELRNRERISVAAASKLLTNILYNYKG